MQASKPDLEPDPDERAERGLSLELLKGTPNRARTGDRARRLAALSIEWADGVHRPFTVALHAFHESLIALRQLHFAIGPTIEDLERAHDRGDEVKAALDGLNAEQVKAILDYVNQALPGVVSGSIYFSLAELAPAEETGGDGYEGIDSPSTSPAWVRMEELLGPEEMHRALDVLTLAYRRMLGPGRARILRGSLLTAGVGAFEALLGSLIQEYYLLNPGALGDETKFSLKDLQGFNSIEDARYEAASRKVDSVLAEDLASWSKWLKEFPKIKLETNCISYSNLFELFQRRHVTVHNAGYASRRYIEKVRSVAPDHAVEEGELLPVDADYLDTAFDELEATGNLLAAGIWCERLPDQEQVVIHSLYQRTYDLMLDGRWDPVVCICSVAKKRSKSADANLIEIHRVNEMLGRKRRGEAIEEPLSEWDVSAMHPRYAIAKAALEDDVESLALMIPRAIDAEHLGWKDVLEWPLLSEFRDSAEFQVIAGKRGLPVEAQDDPLIAEAEAADGNSPSNVSDSSPSSD